MKSLNLKIKKSYQHFILLLISLLGLISGCTTDNDDEEISVAYGSPSADFVIQGEITSLDTSDPLENIQITIAQDSTYDIDADTTYTDADGNYSFDINQLYLTDLSFSLSAKDTAQFYAEQDSLVSFEDEEFTDADGWYVGKATKQIDLSLYKKND